MNTHEPTVVERKVVGPYTAPNEVPAHNVYRIRCSCGWGGVWYRLIGTAARSFTNHADPAVRAMWSA